MYQICPKNMEKKMLQYGLRMNDKNIYTLQFTDDQLLTVQGKEDLEYMIWKIKEEYEKA
jgi:hypothetical protein